ncbi:MAG: ATP-binding protein, partial [Rhodococcus sp. (in: high G+C Gram-positive bacteria)]
VPGNLPSVWLDPERIGQVLSNLLDNALRHSRSQSTVRVRGRVKGDRFILTLTDEGDGVAAEHLPYLFERFYRADAARDRAHGGAGIGLSIAKALVEAHGGQITAASDGAGQGTTFVIALPVHRPKGRHIDCRGTVDA